MRISGIFLFSGIIKTIFIKNQKNVKNFFTIYKYNINKIYDKISLNNDKQFEFINS